MDKITRNCHAECLNAAAASRKMWQRMRATGHGWAWDHYRGWLQDARDFRLGRKFAGHGSKGLPKRMGIR